MQGTPRSGGLILAGRFNARSAAGTIPPSRQRRLNSLVAAATRRHVLALHPALQRRAKIKLPLRGADGRAASFARRRIYWARGLSWLSLARTASLPVASSDFMPGS